MSAIVSDLIWEAAKVEAQQDLKKVRSGLIELRAEIIEDARDTFSERMTEVWEILRSDSGSRFSHLTIPPARGRGYKLEFEVKAKINDGKEDREVDALRVFSESQVNVIGIAAFVTRARLLGHTVLVFDDPVQSMDEEHYRSFAKTLLGTLIDQGFQVVLLTHSDQFASDLSHFHYLQSGYATISTRFSRRAGCLVDEGSRRVPERLKRAEKLAEAGEMDEAWRLVRLAVERLYTLVMSRNDPGFDPASWKSQAAESMWASVDKCMTAAVPGCDVELKDILDMASGGVHDRASRGEKDLKDACSYLRSLLTPLRVGG
jgi:hypothetical protein